MDCKEIETIIEEWYGPGELLLTWKDRANDQCSLWLELDNDEFVIEAQRFSANGDSDTDFDCRYRTFASLQEAKDALTSFALIASEYFDLHCEVMD